MNRCTACGAFVRPYICPECRGVTDELPSITEDHYIEMRRILNLIGPYLANQQHASPKAVVVLNDTKCLFETLTGGPGRG